jgi:hypothetical protein
MASASTSNETPSASTSTDAAAPVGVTAIVANKALEFFKASASAQSNILRCNNPKCWHLYIHDGDDDTVTFTPKVDADGNFTAPTVEVDMNGKLKSYYRMQQGDRIYLSNRAGDVALANSADVIGNYICGECHDHGCHIAARGLDRCALDEMGDAATPNGRATRHATAAAPKPLTIADAAGPMLRGLMMLNDNSFKDHATIVELSEEAMHDARDREGTGGTAQRKAIIKDRHDKMQELKNAAVEKIMVVKNVDKELVALKERHEAEKKVLKTYASGCTIADDEESDQEVDAEDEDAEEATKYYEENGKCVRKLRGKYPKLARRWYGLEPTDNVVDEQKGTVAATEKEITEQMEKLAQANAEKDKAKESYAIIEKEAEEVQKQMVADYDEETEAAPDAAKPKKGGKAKKKVTEMDPEEYAAHKEKAELTAAKRREQNEETRRMREAYPRMQEQAGKYVEMKKNCKIFRVELEKTTAIATEKTKDLESVTNRFEDLNESIATWLGNNEDKPAGWDPKAMLDVFKDHLKSVRSTNGKKRKRVSEAEAKAAAEEAAEEAANADA